MSGRHRRGFDHKPIDLQQFDALSDYQAVMGKNCAHIHTHRRTSCHIIYVYHLRDTIYTYKEL